MSFPSFSFRIKAAIAIVLVAGLAWGAVTMLVPPPDMAARTQAARAMLDRARETRTIPSGVATLPLPKVKSATQRKTLFIAAMLPLIVRENARIEEQRARAASAPNDSPAFAALAYAYGLDPGVARATLLRRIDIVPASLALAQSAVESAWGRSRFARKGNAYFGERTYDPDVPGLTPEGVQKDWPPFRVKSFPSAYLSVRSFMKTLNTHPAYQILRQRRAALRAQGQRPTGLALAPFLHGYSEIGAPYIKRVVATLRSNRLSAFNGLKLVDE